MRFGLLVLLVVGWGGGLSAQTLRIAHVEAAAHYYPLVARVLQDAGIASTFEEVPMARLVAGLASDSIDASYLLYDDLFLANKNLIKVPVPLYTADWVAVTLKPEIRITGADTLKGHKIAVVRGNPVMESIVKDLNPTLSESEEAMFRMLAVGRFDVALCPRKQVPALAAAAGIRKYYIQEPSLVIARTYFGLARSQAGLAARVTAAFQKWVDSGAWTREFAAIAEAHRKAVQH